MLTVVAFVRVVPWKTCGVCARYWERPPLCSIGIGNKAEETRNAFADFAFAPVPAYRTSPMGDERNGTSRHGPGDWQH